MTETLTRTIQMSMESCASCHVQFMIPTSWDESLRETHATFYCPAGHRLAFNGPSETEKLAATAKRLRGQLADERTHSSAQYDQLKATERSLAGHKAAKTRIKNRIAAGMCPCCNRHFVNVERHMSGQHPDFPSSTDASEKSSS